MQKAIKTSVFLFFLATLIFNSTNSLWAYVDIRNLISGSSSPYRFLIVDRKSDNYAKAALFCINRGKIVKSDEISINTDWKICKSYCTFRDNILEMIIIKTSDEDKSKIRSSFYGFPFFSEDKRIDKGYDFYEWPASAAIEPSFYPSKNNNETLITDINLSGLNGIVNVFETWRLGKDFYGNITQKKAADVLLNPLLSPDGSLLSVIIQEDDRIGFYVISTDRKLKKDEVKWNNFVSFLKNHKGRKLASYLWNSLSVNARKGIISTKDGGMPDAQVKYLILEDINKIMKNKELYLVEMRAECTPSEQKKEVGTLEKFYETYYKQFINVIPVKTSSYPFHAPDLLTLNRVYLEFCLPDSIKKSSLPKLLFTGFPIYRKEAGKGIRIPHKVWSPDGKKLLFAGSPKKEYCPGLYTVDVKTGRVEKVYESPNFSEVFNPDLEWTDNGMVITCGQGIFINSQILPNIPHNLLFKLELPDSIRNLKNGKISPDGKRLLFSGEKDNGMYVFIYNFREKKLVEERLEDFNNDSLWAVWEEPGKETIIKNGLDYQTHRKYEDLR